MKFIYIIAIFLVGTLHADSSIQLGGNYAYLNCKVDEQPSFHGNLGGVQGKYEYKPCDGLYAAVKGTWRQGNIENSFATRSLVYVDAQERIGYTFGNLCDNFTATLFTGFGYRYLRHKIHNSDEPTVSFEYNEFYVPVGFISKYTFCSFSVGLNATWLPQVYPTVLITPLKGARWVLENTINNVLVEVPLIYFFGDNECFSVILKPFYEHWEDGHSTAKTRSGEALGLPKNNYNFYGAELSFAFSF